VFRTPKTHLARLEPCRGRASSWADLAVQAGSRLYTDSASGYRAVRGYVHEFINRTQEGWGRTMSYICPVSSDQVQPAAMT
jgi:hypothetical protein